MAGTPPGKSISRVGDLLLVGSAPLAALAPMASGVPLSAALVGGTCAWAYLFWARRADTGRVVGVLLLWAFALSLATILFTVYAPERAQELIPRGATYWARSGA